MLPPYFYLGPAVAPHFYNSRFATEWMLFVLKLH